MCHRSDGRLCAGWVATHDMEESLALRIACHLGEVEVEVVEAARDYETDVPLWPSGAAAAEHGLRDVDAPGPDARRVMEKLGSRERRTLQVKEKCAGERLYLRWAAMLGGTDNGRGWPVPWADLSEAGREGWRRLAAERGLS